MTTPTSSIPDKQRLQKVFGSFTGKPLQITVINLAGEGSLHVPASHRYGTASHIENIAQRFHLCPVFVVAGAARDRFDPHYLTIEFDKDTQQTWRISKFILGRNTVLDEIDLSIGESEMILNKKVGVRQPLKLKRK